MLYLNPTNSSCIQSLYDFHNQGATYLGKMFNVLIIHEDDNCLLKILKCITIPFTAIAHFFGSLCDWCNKDVEPTSPMNKLSTKGAPSKLEVNEEILNRSSPEIDPEIDIEEEIPSPLTLDRTTPMVELDGENQEPIVFDDFPIPQETEERMPLCTESGSSFDPELVSEEAQTIEVENRTALPCPEPGAALGPEPVSNVDSEPVPVEIRGETRIFSLADVNVLETEEGGFRIIFPCIEPPCIEPLSSIDPTPVTEEVQTTTTALNIEETVLKTEQEEEIAQTPVQEKSSAGF